MSWLFSQALVEEYSAGTSLAGQPFAQLNVMPTPHKFWRNDKMMESSDHSRFGLTSQVLTDDHGTELLTSFLAVSRVRISAQRAEALESKANGQVFGSTCSASFARYAQKECSWKTAQLSLLGDSELFLETWPRWGSMRNGESFLRPIPALPICESASGLWPTVTVHGNYNRPGISKSSGMGLASAVKLIPTPTAMNFTGGAAMCKWGGAGAWAKMKTMFTSEEINGQLNPQWVEWLMGWPIGWACLKPLAMDKFREWQQQHGGFSANET